MFGIYKCCKKCLAHQQYSPAAVPTNYIAQICHVSVHTHISIDILMHKRFYTLLHSTTAVLIICTCRRTYTACAAHGRTCSHPSLPSTDTGTTHHRHTLVCTHRLANSRCTWALYWLGACLHMLHDTVCAVYTSGGIYILCFCRQVAAFLPLAIQDMQPHSECPLKPHT